MEIDHSNRILLSCDALGLFCYRISDYLSVLLGFSSRLPHFTLDIHNIIKAANSCDRLNDHLNIDIRFATELAIYPFKHEAVTRDHGFVGISVEVKHISYDWHELAGIFTLCCRKQFEFSPFSSGSLMYDPEIFPLFLVSLSLILIRCC